ncbi:hypothetical protein COCNU_04G014570 [Cocos nucifera]|uniref:Uncharacterized protein n=1 Tax=Cocos nucifera TaxID=13894 RepID=A0A8K0I777_COCNU|nr:hypothetical protein COCNU_04G014570 [Cocos nucifera]
MADPEALLRPPYGYGPPRSLLLILASLSPSYILHSFRLTPDIWIQRRGLLMAFHRNPTLRLLFYLCFPFFLVFRFFRCFSYPLGNSSSSSLHVRSMAAADGSGKKLRKPYTITKSRDRWTAEEHERFLDALLL